ncbi:MAG: SMI1/KNR4 family protein [bacterium]
MVEKNTTLFLAQLNRIKEILSYFNQSEVIYHPPASGELISQAQGILNVNFPTGLINFLFSANGISLLSEDFLGLSSDLYVPSMVDITLWARHKYPEFLHEFLVFFVDGFENFYCIDTRTIKNGESPIAYWDTSDKININIYASSVFKFVEMMSLLLTSLYNPKGEPFSQCILAKVTGFENFNWIRNHDPDIIYFRNE